MELKYKATTNSETESFYIERKKFPYFGVNWHYHDEYELIFILKGSGVRIVGDSMDPFNESNLVFIGSGVPHLFKNEEKEESTDVDYIVLKFNTTLNGLPLFSLPEFSKIQQLLDKANRGILFSKKTIAQVKDLIIAMVESKEAERMIYLFKVLHILALEEEVTYLSSENFSLKSTSKGENRIQNVIDYISENYTKDISLEDLAEVAYMTTNSFCRYFKSRTGKTAFQFIREYRVNKACQMLINGEKSISEICFDTGFNSFSTFNRIFKNLKNYSASEYKSKYSKIYL
ncbi:AraC family transcriptional regulator [Urechidicola sp. KH5]